MRAAVGVELLKLTRSPVGVISTFAVLGGMLGLLGGITAAVAGGNPEVIAKAGAGRHPGLGRPAARRRPGGGCRCPARLRGGVVLGVRP